MINMAVAGCGYWGPNLIRNFKSLPDCNVPLVCDTDPSRLAYIRSLYSGTKTTTDFSTVMKDSTIDAVAISTPVRTHFEMARLALMAGKHTFIEKPMVSSVKEGIELIHLAQKNDLTLMVGHTFVYSPPVRKIKEIISNGELGEINYVSARRLNLGLFQKDINVAWDLAPHDISIILYVLGEMPLSVNCQGKAHVTPNIEDVTSMTLNFSNGGFATIQSSWLDPNKVRDMTFVGSHKMLLYDDLQPMEKIKIYDKRVEAPPHYDTFAEFHYSYHYGDMYSPYIKQFEPLKAECSHFLDCIRSGDLPESNGYEALKVISILEAASTSLKREGGKVMCDVLPFKENGIIYNL
jgi:predicted dehydrogenase